MASGMASSNSLAQVQKLYCWDNNTKSDHFFPITHHSQMSVKFLLWKDRAECFHQRETSARTAVCRGWYTESLGFSKCKWRGDAVVLYLEKSWTTYLSYRRIHKYRRTFQMQVALNLLRGCRMVVTSQQQRLLPKF